MIWTALLIAAGFALLLGLCLMVAGSRAERQAEKLREKDHPHAGPLP